MQRMFIAIQFFFFFAASVIGTTLYLHNQFAANARVSQVEKEVFDNKAILCKMAIHLKVQDAVQICTRQRGK